MAGFKEHVLDKYFAYRRRYVEHIEREAPQRASLAVLSELARLGFSIAGNALCALIFWALASGAFGRGGGFGLWPVFFGVLALVPTAFGLLAMAGFAEALVDRRAVRARSAAALKGRQP